MRVTRPLVRSIAIFSLVAAACGAGASVYIGKNPAYPNALLVVVKEAGGSREQPKALFWKKDADGAGVETKEVVVQGDTTGSGNLPAMLKGAWEFADIPAGIYTVAMRHSDGKDQDCSSTLSWEMKHGTLSGELYSPHTGKCGESQETIKAGETLWFFFDGDGGDGIVLHVTQTGT